LTTVRRCYQLFGLRIASDLDLPELFDACKGPVDVVIRAGRVAPPESNDTGCSRGDDGVTIEVPGVARFHIREGKLIIVDAAPGADPRNVRIFLLGTASGVLIHQRGLLPLHANAIEAGAGAVAFCGESGAGKSTLAAWFHDRGARVVADDVCVIGLGEKGEGLVMPGLPRFRLWREALERSGRRVDGHLRSFAGQASYDKYDVPIASEGSVDEPLRLRAVFLLSRGTEFGIQRLQGLVAAEALFANTYRGAYVSAAGATKRHYLACVSLLKTTPIFEAARTWNLERFDDEACAISSFLDGLG
jgi:hypothetical protein